MSDFEPGYKLAAEWVAAVLVVGTAAVVVLIVVGLKYFGVI